MASTTISIYTTAKAPVFVSYLRNCDSFAAAVEDRNGHRVEFFLSHAQLAEFSAAITAAQVEAASPVIGEPVADAGVRNAI